jgi:hypothetical protein
MERKKWSLILILSIVLGVFIPISTPVHATLWDRGEGLIYDDVLDITWLQDANYACTSGYDFPLSGDWDCRFIWYGAKQWVDNLVYAGYDDWRLPKADDCYGLNCSGRGDEMGYMFYGNLGGTGFHTTHPKYSPVSSSFIDGNNNTVSFLNLQSGSYWYETVYPYYDGDDGEMAWTFSFKNGGKGAASKCYNPVCGLYYAWPVRDGDVQDKSGNDAKVGDKSTPGFEMVLLVGGIAIMLIQRKKKAI